MGMSLVATLRLAAAACTAAASCCALAGPLDRSIVDPGAIWLVHVDVDAAKLSPVGEQTLARMTTERHSPLARMECELGISPAKDIKSLTVFAVPATMSDGIVIFTTSDAADHLGEHLSKANPKSYRAEKSPQGVPVHVWRTRRGEMRAAVYPGRRDGERLLVMADTTDELETGINALTSRSNGPTPGIMPAAEPREGSIVFFTCGDLNSQPGQQPPSAAILQASRSLVLDIGQTPASTPARMYGQAVMNTDDAASAVKVQQMAQGILALLTTPREGVAASPPAEEAALMQEMIKNVSIITDDRRCLVASDHDSQVFARVIDLVMQKNAAAAKARHEAMRERGPGDPAGGPPSRRPRPEGESRDAAGGPGKGGRP